MNFWRSMMNLPQPLKTCFVAYLVVFAAAFVSIPLMAFAGRDQTAVMPWAMGALGFSAFLLGLVLAFDLRGSARAYAAMTKDFKPMGIDYSKSFFSKPLFIRFFGGMFAIVGICFTLGSTIFASRMS